MEKEDVTLIDLAKGATDIANATLGVSNFVFARMSSNIKMEDVDALSGLLAGLSALADKHSNEVDNFLDGK